MNKGEKKARESKPLALKKSHLHDTMGTTVGRLISISLKIYPRYTGVTLK